MAHKYFDKVKNAISGETSTPIYQDSSLKSVADIKKRGYAGTKKDEVDNDYISKYLQDSQNYSKKLADRYANRSYSSLTNAYSDTLERTDLQRRGDAIKTYLSLNKDKMDKGSYEKLLDYIQNVQAQDLSVNYALNKMKEYASQFADEDEYNRAIKDQAYRQKHSGKSYSDLMSEYEKADEAEKSWIDENKYSFMSSDELKAEIENLEGKKTSKIERLADKIGSLGRYFQADENGNIEYVGYKEPDEYVLESEKKVAEQSKIDYDQARVRLMREELDWRDKYETLSANQQKAVYDYADALKNYNNEVAKSYRQKAIESGVPEEDIDTIADLAHRRENREFTKTLQEESYNLGKSSPALNLAMSAGTSIAGGIVGTADILAQKAFGKSDYGIDAYSPGQAFNVVNQSGEEGALDRVEWKPLEKRGIDYDVGDFFYKLGTMALENYARYALASAAVGEAFGTAGWTSEAPAAALEAVKDATSAGTMALMSTQVFSNAVVEGKKKGYSDDKAIIYGVVKGLIEGATEKWSVEKFMDAENAKNIFSAFVQTAVPEGTEELAGNWLERITDRAMNGDYSDYALKMKELTSKGMSEKEAMSKIFMEWLGEDVEAFALGALSGGFGGGGRYAGAYAKSGASDVYNAIANKLDARAQTKAAVGSQLEGEKLAEIARAVSSDENTASLIEARQAAQQAYEQSPTKENRKALEKTTKALVKATQKSMTANNKADFRSGVQAYFDSLEENGAAKYKDTKLITDTLLKFQEGKVLSPYENGILQSVSGEDLSSAIRAGQSNISQSQSKLNEAAERASDKYYENKIAEAAEKKMIAADEETTVTVDGEEKPVEMFKLTSVGVRNGEVSYTVDVDGESYDSSDNNLSLGGDGLIIEALAKAGATSSQINTALNLSRKSNLSKAAFASAAAEQVQQAKQGITRRGALSKKLNAEEREALYKIGKDITEKKKNRDKNKTGVRRTDGSVNMSENISENKRAELLRDENSRKKLNTIQALAKFLGRDIVLVETYKGADGKFYYRNSQRQEVPFNANGCFYAESGKILIDVNSDRGVMNTLSHELVHLIRSESEYEYRKLADWLVNKYHEKGQNLNSLVYKKMDEENIEDYDAAFEEVVAESWSLALETERTVDNLTELARENKGLFDTLKEGFEKIFNGFKDYLKTYNPILKTREAWNAQALSQLDEYSDLFTQALYNVTHGEKAAVISANEENSEIREGKKQIKELIDSKGNSYGIGVYLDTNIFNNVKTRNWGRVLHSFVYKHLAGVQVPVKDKDGNIEIIEFAKSNERVKKDGSNNFRKVNEELARKLDLNSQLAVAHAVELIAVSQNEDRFSPENSHQWLDKNGWEFRTVYIQNAVNKKIYTADLNLANTRDGRKILYDINNIKEADGGDVASVPSNGGMRSHIASASKNNIPDSSANVNTESGKRQEKVDSEGRKLSEGQIKYFEKSKIRDEDGNLLRVYHGTDSDFTVFDRTKTRQNMDIQGFFFSPWELDASGYGPKVKAYYLNITNPAPEQVGYRALRMYQGQNEAGRKAREYLIKLGYDGVNNENEEYIAFYSEQVKLIDNENPTENEDVRYQTKLSAQDRYSEYDKPITLRDIFVLRSIGRKSVNKFTSNDIEKAQKWAYKFYTDINIKEKSPFFRAWFGDWRAYDKNLVVIAKIPKYIKSSEERKKNRGTFKNDDTGWEIRVSKDGEDNTISHASDKRYSEKALAGIDDLVKHSVLLDTEVHEHHKNNKKNDFIAFDHKLYALGIHNKRIALYKLTVEEMYHDVKNTNDKRFHNLKYITKVAEVSADAIVNNSGSAVKLSTTNYTISDLYSLVKQYDKDFTSGKEVNPDMLNDEGTPKVFYHGAKNGGGFTVFKGWQYFTENKQYAERYTERGNDKSLYQTYLKMEKPFDTRDPEAAKIFENMRSEYGLSELQASGLPDWTDGYDIAEFIEENGLDYDGIILDEGGDLVNGEPVSRGVSYVVRNPEQIKSATDNIGTFDGEEKDIRYQSKLSDRAVEHLQAENKYLKRLLRIQGQLTHGKLFTRTSTQEVAKSVINQFGAKGMDWVKLGDRINKAYESIMDNANHHNLNWDTIMDELRPIAKEIHDSIPLQRSEQATDILKYIHSSNIRLDEAQKQEVAFTFGSYDRFRKALMGSVTVSNFGTELDSWWQGAAEDFPDVFRADINSADMGVELYDIINGLKESYEDDYGDEAVNEIAQELYDKFWTAATLYTEADKHAREINELKAKHRENIQKIKEDYDLRLKTQNAAEKYVKKQKDMMKDKADRIEKTATKNQIIKELTKVANSLTANSKNNYIPDDLKPFAKALLEAVNGVNVYIDSSVLDNIPDELEEGNVLTMLTYEVKRAARGKTVGEMSLEETRTVYRAVKALRRAIDFEKEAIIGDKRVEISNSAQKLISQIRERAKDKIVYEGKIRPMFWSLLDPVRAFNHIGSAELTSYFNEARKGDDTMALNIQEIMKFTESLAKKYNTKKWNMDELLEISFSDFIPSEENNDPGRPKEIKETVTLNELMYMYALTKREQAYEHLEVGGYVLKNAIKIKNKHLQRTAKGTKISVQELRAICSQMLTQEQRTYVDECVEYMSTVMAAKGNEISQKLYGIDLFTEEFYIPIISSGDYIKGETKAELKTKDLGDNYKMLKNMGFTNSVQVKANNPILIQDFTSVFTEHCNEMAMYNSYVIGIENLNKLFKWKGDGESVSAAITNGCGYSATAYINTFLKDLNGGRTAERNGILDQGAKLFGKMKKTAVGYSFSTVIQQPTAIVRAMAMIEPKYFIAQSIHHKQTWNELKEHCPVAITKELGGFDMGSKKTTAKAIEDTMLKTKALDIVDEVGMWGAAKGDELGWNIIWNAVKAETKAEHKSISEAEYWKICKERFTEVVTNTQVYDSVFTRSDIMRSKNPLAKLSTAFMGEPTKVLNMYIQAITDAKRGKTSKLHGLRVFASVIMSQILAAVAKSLPYALRDDDDDKSLTEKYMYKLCYSLIDELNPINLLPYIRDGWDALCGDSNMRGDFAIFNEITNAYKALSSSNKSGYRKAEEFIGSISKLLGLPIKNIMREFRSVRNLFASIYNGNFFEPIDGQTIRKDVVDNLPEMPFDIDEKIKNEFAVTVKRASVLMDKGKFEKGKRILLEYKESKIEEYMKKGISKDEAEKKVNSSMRSSATSYYKPLYLEAAEKKDYAEMNRIKIALNSMGIYDDVQKTVDKWVKDPQK